MSVCDTDTPTYTLPLTHTVLSVEGKCFQPRSHSQSSRTIHFSHRISARCGHLVLCGKDRWWLSTAPKQVTSAGSAGPVAFQKWF